MKGLFMIKPKYGTIENKNKNKILLKKYPFLRPSPLFVKSTVLRYKKYDYSFTMADFIYPGFLKAFGCDLFNELRNKLLETDDLYNIRFVFFEADMWHSTYWNIKFFKNFNGDKNQINNILKKYLDLKKVTCPECGNSKNENDKICDKCRQKKDRIKFLKKLFNKFKNKA